MTNNSMSQNNAIPWSKDYFLNWLDFQAESNSAVFEDVHSTIKYRYTWTVNSDSIGNQIRFFIENIDLTAEFYPLLSWVRQPQATPQLLRHEQGHFDITEIYSRVLRKTLQETKFKKYETTPTKVVLRKGGRFVS